MPVRSPLDDLADLLRRSASAIGSLLWRLAAAALGRSGARQEAAQVQLGEHARGARWFADLMGRRRLLLEADSIARRRVEPTPLVVVTEAELVPPVPFREAIASLLDREPRLVQSGADRDAAQAHQRSVGFELARSMSLEVTERVQAEVARGMREGRTRDQIVRAILAAPGREEASDRVRGWTAAYADTVWRTNVATAHAAGRFRQLANPAIAAVIGGLRYVAVMDSDTRPNHAAMNDVIARADDPIWERHSPPQGWNCRCSLELVPADEMRRVPARVRVPAGAGPDPGFGSRGRPDRSVYI